MGTKIFLKLLNTLCIFLASQIIYSNSQLQGEALRFKLAAINLPNCDFEFDGVSDPFATVWTAVQVSRHSRHWEKFGQTSIKRNTLNPQWDEVFLFNYVEGKNQTWRIFVHDKDDAWYNPFDDPLGRVEVKVDDYLREVRKTRENGTLLKPIQLFLTQPLGGAVIITPVFD